MSIDALNIGLLVATLAVIAGVILEGEEHVREYKKQGWRPILPKAGFAILVVGLGGEIVFQTWIASVESERDRVSSTRVATLELEAQKLHAQIMWRRLSKGQHDAIAALARADGKHSMLCDHTEDPETSVFAADICGALRDGGWNVEEGLGVFSEAPFGVRVYPSRDDADATEAIAFGHQLSAAGHFHIDVFWNDHAAKLQVVVGSKPPAK